MRHLDAFVDGIIHTQIAFTFDNQIWISLGYLQRSIARSTVDYKVFDIPVILSQCALDKVPLK